MERDHVGRRSGDALTGRTPGPSPKIAQAINGGYNLLGAKCNRCDRVSLVALRASSIRRTALYCEPCSDGWHCSRRQRAHILGLEPSKGNETETDKTPAQKAPDDAGASDCLSRSW
jgi:hypothetical protein